MSEKVTIAGNIKDVGNTKKKKTGTWRSMRPEIDKGKCIACGRCVTFCPEACIKLNPKADVDYDYCKGCGVCANVCPVKAIAMKEEPCMQKKCQTNDKND